jgi:hypothetical protein
MTPDGCRMHYYFGSSRGVFPSGTLYVILQMSNRKRCRGSVRQDLPPDSATKLGLPFNMYRPAWKCIFPRPLSVLTDFKTSIDFLELVFKQKVLAEFEIFQSKCRVQRFLLVLLITFSRRVFNLEPSRVYFCWSQHSLCFQHLHTVALLFDSEIATSRKNLGLQKDMLARTHSVVLVL